MTGPEGRRVGLTPLRPSDLGVMPRPEDQLRWSAAEKLVAQRNMHHLFPHDVVAAGDHARPLRPGPGIDIAYRDRGRPTTLDDYLADSQASALLVLKRGSIVLERYGDGNDPATLWASRSMAKSVTATLLGAAVRDGAIRSLADGIVAYVPELRGTLYDDVSVEHALRMVTGVPFNEDYGDPDADVHELQACTVGGRKGAFLELLRRIGARTGAGISPPGRSFSYSSLDSVLCGLVLERATGARPAAYLSEKIWRPCGMEADGFWNTEANGGATFTASGIGATLRDYARFGQFVLEECLRADGRVLPAWWMREATRASGASLEAGLPYGFQWWLHSSEGVHSSQAGAIDPDAPSAGPVPMRHADAMFYALGNGGQAIAINPAEEVVIVKWAAWSDSRGPGGRGRHADASLYAAIVEELAV